VVIDGGPGIEFSQAGLVQLLGRFLSAGYTSVGFPEADPDQAHLVLRHDVDLDLRSAVAVAAAEEPLGVESTFFLMVRGDCYNLLDGAARRAVRELVAMGRRIGLHLDVTLYEPDELADGAARELDVLAWVAGQAPEAISFHRPAPHLVGQDEVLFSVPHTYQKHFVESIAYVSDSQGRFRFGHPLESEAFLERRALHLLLHPIWWAGEQAEGRDARLRGLVADHGHAFAARVAANCLPYREMIG
jgi:hypothetical protein